MTNTFLTELGFTTGNGLVHDLNEAQNNVERLYIEEVKKLPRSADAVFFRRFYTTDTDNHPYSSAPAVCIFKEPDSFFNSRSHKELHAALWSAGKIDIYIILGETRIDILNARRAAKRKGKDVSLEGEELVLVEKVIKDYERLKYSAHLFGSGTFWEQSEFQEKIDGNSNPYAFLLDYLMEVRKQFFKNRALGLEAATIDKLLITCILVKFLEEIKDDDGKHTLNDIYKKYNIDSETFEEGLSKGFCVDILADLSKEFNGKIFDTFSDNELINIAEADLVPIAKFLRSDIDVQTNQLFIWKQYSFKHLPAEVISAIYENFIQAEAERSGEQKKGVVYTPLHLVNLLIDESMPLDQPELFDQNRFTVLDPACGSGVFLVAAYKRMLQWWTINNWQKTGQITYPNQTIAKQILENNIFGVDIEEVAALVSIFGLTTAFLDKLTPKEIWNNLKFKDLGEKNIQGINFIDWARTAKEQQIQFDLVIGNPPFNPSTKGTITDKDLKALTGKKVPGNKLALKFFEAALFFGKKVCMIIPSNVFLYNKSDPSHTYRKETFTNCTVEKIYDFTHLRESLFVKKNPRRTGLKRKTERPKGRTPVIALIVHNQSSKDQSIEHTVLKRELLSEQKTRFEIDYYDKHHVRWDWAIDEKKHFVWKTNLLGGGRLFHLVYRLSLLRKLGRVLSEKEKSGLWSYSTGYITKRKRNEKIKADYITGQNTIRPKSFNEDGHFEKMVEESSFFVEIRKKRLFEAPHVIFQLVLGDTKIPMAYVKDYLCFNSSFVGISAPIEEENELYEMYRRIHENQETSNLYRAFILANSPKAVVYHETSILKEDIDNLPYPEDEKYLMPSKEESIIINDVLNYYRHLGKAITKNSAGKILHDPITSKELEAFGEIYCSTLNDIYAENGRSWQSGQVLQTPTFVSYQFGFGKDGGMKREMKENSEQAFHSLFNDISSNKGAIHKRIIRHYKHENGFDCVYFIKPTARRYWLQSIALRDADDTFMDLKKAGY